MKKVLLSIVAIMFAIVVNAEEKYVYCELVGTGKLFSTKVTVEVDFGQSTKFWSDNRLVDESGNAIKFNSMVDAMNWMGNEGWVFIQAYVVSVSGGSTSGGQNVYHWVLKKDISNLSESEKSMFMDKLTTKDTKKRETK